MGNKRVGYKREGAALGGRREGERLVLDARDDLAPLIRPLLLFKSEVYALFPHLQRV